MGEAEVWLHSFLTLALAGGKKAKQSHYRPRGFQEVEVPRFQDNRHMKVVRLSGLCTGRLYLQEILLVLILLEAESTTGP
jgi:hypothetical protein